ncbi:unnamed protein product [Sphagnum balticum]
MLMLLTCSALVATALPETVDEFDLDDFSFELPISSNEDETTRIDSQLSKACANQLTPFEVVEILTSSNPPFGLPPVQVQNFLAQNESFYKFTNPPVVRELHDIPTLMPFQYHCAPSWAFSANAFYQQTRKVSLTQNHPQIGCYLNLNLPDILALIENDEIPADEIPSVVGIIGRNLTVEERRFGAMLDVWKHYKRWIFTAALPFILLNVTFSSHKQFKTSSWNLRSLLAGVGCLAIILIILLRNTSSVTVLVSVIYGFNFFLTVRLKIRIMFG